MSAEAIAALSNVFERPELAGVAGPPRFGAGGVGAVGAAGAPGDGADFAASLRGALGQVQATEQAADQAASALAAGRADVHTAMIAMEKADISLRLLVSVRNKILEAYQEVMRMSV